MEIWVNSGGNQSKQNRSQTDIWSAGQIRKIKDIDDRSWRDRSQHSKFLCSQDKTNSSDSQQKCYGNFIQKHDQKRKAQRNYFPSLPGAAFQDSRQGQRSPQQTNIKQLIIINGRISFANIEEQSWNRPKKKFNRLVCPRRHRSHFWDFQTFDAILRSALRQIWGWGDVQRSAGKEEQ